MRLYDEYIAGLIKPPLEIEMDLSFSFAVVIFKKVAYSGTFLDSRRVDCFNTKDAFSGWFVDGLDVLEVM